MTDDERKTMWSGLGSEEQAELLDLCQIEDGFCYAQPVVVTATVVQYEDEVLLLRKKEGGFWTPPGGKVELKETPLRSTVRELYEETGVTCPLPAFDTMTNIFESGRHFILLWYRSRLIHSRHSIAANREPTKHSDVAWFPWTDLPSPLGPGFRAWIAGKLRHPCP